MLQVLLLTGAITVPIRLHQSTLRVADGLLAPWNQGAAPATLWDSWPYCLGRMACVGADFVTDSGVVNQQLLTLRGTNLSKFQDFSLPFEVGKRRKKPLFVDDVGPALQGRVYKCVWLCSCWIERLLRLCKSCCLKWARHPRAAMCVPWVATGLAEEVDEGKPVSEFCCAQLRTAPWVHVGRWQTPRSIPHTVHDSA